MLYMENLNSLKTNHKIAAALISAILPAVLVALALFWTSQQVERDIDNRRRTYALIVGANTLLGNLQDAETGQRGYALTGNEAFLEQYLAVRDHISGDLEALRAGTVVKVGQQHLNTLAPLVDAKLADIAQVIELRRSNNMPATIALVQSGQGRPLMNSIRTEINSYIQMEEVELARHEANLQESLRRLFFIVVAVSLLTLLFSLSLVFFIYRETQHQLKKLLHQETRDLLEIQEETSRQLQQANATLHISEEKLAVTLNSIGDAVITTDAQGRVTLINPLAERLTGWTQTQANGRPVDDIFHIISKETRQPATIPIMATLAHGTKQGMANHTVLIAADGSECDIADSCAPIRDRNDQIVGAVLVFRDVTGEYAAQQALRDQQFYTRSLIESNIDALMATDTSGIITDANKQAETLTGCTYDELIQTPFKNYFTDPELAEAGIQLALSERTVANYELTARASDGKETLVSYNAATFYDRDNKLQGVFVAARDITEHKRLDQILRERNRELEIARSAAEKANLAKSDFLSSMSHELRTPLSAILGFAQLLESGTPAPSTTQKRSIDQILKAGWYLLELINEILDLALIESGKLSLSLEPTSLAEVIHECQAMIEPLAKQRGISVAFPNFDVPCVVMADRTRLKQVLINLLSNAIKYNKPDGDVVVVYSTGNPGRALLCIEDTGAGLSPGELAQLFQPFNRLGQELKAEEGTGIGLVMSKRLIELMGGVIGVESTVNVGSVFWIELQLTDERQSTVNLAQPTAVVQTRVSEAVPLFTLLYVEDNPANLMLVEDIITRRPDIRLLSARDGIRGIEMARASLPDVILMDINLPGISGLNALRILADDPATMHIPVVALSANAMPDDIEKGLAAGFFRYLTKPLKVNEFMNTLDLALKFSKTKITRSDKQESA